MAADTTQAEVNAVEFGHHYDAPGWYSAFLVACSTENKRGNPNKNENKLGIKAFSVISHQTDKTVTSVLAAWNKAAEDGWVPPADELTPEDGVDGIEFDSETHTYAAWLEFFDDAMAPKRRRNAASKKKERSQKNSDKIAKEIASDPEAKKAARKALQEEDRKEWEAKRAKAAEELAEAELQAMVAGGRIPTDEELEPKSTKLTVMADALEAEAEIIGAIEKLPKLAKEMQDVLRKVVDYGSIPDNGGVALSQMQEFYKTIQACVWEAAPMVPEESEAR
jgi:flagellar biosynthesis GTPase FlhF